MMVLGETPWAGFVFEAADWCDACPRDTPFGEKKHVSRAGFAEMAGKLSSDTLFWAEKSVSRQVRGPSVKWLVLRMGVLQDTGSSVKWLVLRMGSSRNVGLSAKWLVLRMGAFQNGSDGDER